MKQHYVSILRGAAVLVVAFGTLQHALAATSRSVQERVSAELKEGSPVVAHVVVALCDNVHQGIVPVPANLGNGQDPSSNLYWGALYGVRTYFTRGAGYELLRPQEPPPDGILERIVLRKTLSRAGKDINVFVVADAWDGRRIKEAIRRFLEYSAGAHGLNIRIDGPEDLPSLSAGGHASLIAFVGHNGLMDFSLSSYPDASRGALPRSSVVLACASEPYFTTILENGGSHPLLLTTGLMAPEAYTLEAAVSAFVAGAEPAAVRQAAAEAYNKYQKCGSRAALRLFVTR